MIACILIIVAGWARSAWAALAIFAIIVVVSTMLALPRVNAFREAAGIPPATFLQAAVPVIVQTGVVALICFGIGYGARVVKERRT